MEISENAAKVLLELCQKSMVVSAQSKIALGHAQMELEQGLQRLEQVLAPSSH